MCQDRDDAWNRRRGARVHCNNSGMGPVAAQKLEMKDIVHPPIGGETGSTCDNDRSLRIRPTASKRRPLAAVDVGYAVKRVADCAISGTAAKRTLAVWGHSAGGGIGHHLSSGAISALERLCVQESLLCRVKSVVLGESFYRDDLPSFGAKGWRDAGMNSAAIEPDGAGAAVARVAAGLNAVIAKLS